MSCLSCGKAADGTIVKGFTICGNIDLGLSLSFQHSISAMPSGSDGTGRKTDGSGTTCTSVDLEACRADHQETLRRKKNHHCPPSLQGDIAMRLQ